ncbi:MAG: 30S ribosomal protein S2 [Candidatus Magasanikbacteria bacterium]
MFKMPSLLEMLTAGVHFGHQTSRWHPKMSQYLFGSRNGVHVINLEKTQEELQKSLDYVKTLASQGKVILFVGTKKQAKVLIQTAADACGMPYITERWIGGLLTNFPEVRTRLKKYKNLKEQFATHEIERYTKKEQVRKQKDLEKMDRYLLGIVGLDKIPDAIYIADMRTEKTAIAEANRMNVPIVGVCDSNVNPEKAEYIIPANDDAVNAIKMIADLLAVAANEGKADWEQTKLKMAAEKVKEEKTAPVRAKVEKIERRAVKIAESV